MKEQKIQSPPLLQVLFLSWFFTGKFPKAPGTVGSLATLPLIYLLHSFNLSLNLLLTFITILYVVSVYVTQKVQETYHLHDPQWIVIDEVIGMLITWSFIRTTQPQHLFLVFGCFRFFDIVKVWPASYFDKLHHGIGTITDDVVSGIYAGIAVKALITLFP